MQPPHGGSSWGPKMSKKGTVNTNKNGGAHGEPHGVQILLKSGELVEDFSVKSSYVDDRSVGEEGDNIQDGVVTPVKSETLRPLDVFMDDFMETPSQSQAPDSVPQTHDIISTEWIKTDNVGGLALFDQTCSNSETEGVGQLLGVEQHDDVGDLSANTQTASAEVSDDTDYAPIVSDATTSSLLLPSGSTTLSDSLTIAGTHLVLPSDEQPRKDFVIKIIQEGDTLTHSQEDRSHLSSQDRACLEEIERGSQLTAEEEELMEDRRKELQLVQALEFDQSLADQDKNRDLSHVISPQDLSLPDQSLDLDTERPLALLIGGDTSPNGADPQGGISMADIQKLLSNSAAAAAPTSVGASNPSGASVQSDVVAPSSVMVQNAAGGVATVQITTDSVKNTTQILVNTGSGVQLYQVNTADLDQAADAFQPLLAQQTSASTTTTATQPQKTTCQVPGLVQDAVLVPSSKVVRTPASAQAINRNAVSSTAEKMPLLSMQPSPYRTVQNKELEGEKTWVCNVKDCDQKFTKPSQLKVHLMNHTGERPFKCSVTGCDWAFTTAHKLKRHHEAHLGDKNFVCEVIGCGKKFTTVYNLRTHKKLHTRQNTLECPQPDCQEKFSMQKQLDQHLKVHGNALKTYKCPYEGCERKFYSRLCMGSHARVHQRTLDLTCHFEGCGRSFDKLCRLKAHLRSHTGERPYPCPVESCDWAFATSSKLRRHLQKHTGERQYVCTEEGCGKRFMRSEHLKGHMIIHTGTKPFACHIEGCDARFTAQSTLYMHIKKHRQNANQRVTYFCPLEGCNHKYNNKASLRTHIEKHYQKQLPTSAGEVSLVPVLDLQEGLDTLVQQQMNSAGAVSTGLENTPVTGLMTLDGTPINPADILAAGDQPIIMGPTDLQTLNQQGLTTIIPVTIDLGNGQVGQVALQGVLNTVHGLVAVTPSGVASEAPLTTPRAAPLPTVISKSGDGPRVIVAPDMDRGPPPGDATAGSARTDYHSNQRLSTRAKMRQQLLKGSSGLDSNMEGSGVHEGAGMKSASLSETEPSEASGIFNLSDMMTSQAITFRDPETGAIYVQTQLLQDDPPNPDAFDETGMDTSDQSGLEAEFSSILQDDHGSDVVDGTGGAPVGFSGSTINLQDLE